MSRIRCKLHLALGALPLAAFLAASTLAAQATSTRIVSHEVSISRNAATLRLELADGRTVDLGVLDGRAELNGTRLGTAARGSDLDRSWRELLNQVIDASSDALPVLLTEWRGDGSDVGSALDRALEEAVSGVGTGLVAPVDPAPLTDSVVRLQQRIAELERQRAELAATDVQVSERSRDRWRPGPLHYVVSGVGRLVSVLVVYAVLLAIGFGTIFFGGRKYIEGVADTVRHSTTRSLLVGIAGTFLILPAFVLGIIALAISIVGIPALLIWVPAFPVAVFGALVLGYLGVAHAGGEALAERRFYVNDWFQRGNSYYFLLTGVGLLLAFFVGSAVVSIAGPWLRVISGLLTFFAVTTTWAAFTVGFGAVLISRGGKRPRGMEPVSDPDLFSEEAAV